MNSFIQIYYPTPNDSVLNAYLKQLQTCVLTSIGPNGKFKLITKSNNRHTILTNTSKYLLDSFYNFDYIKSNEEELSSSKSKAEFYKWLFEFMKNSIQSHLTSFYDGGLLTVYLVNQFFMLNVNNDRKYSFLIDFCFEKVYQLLKSTKNGEIQGSSVVFKLDLSSTKTLRSLIQTVLCKYSIRRYEIDNSFLNLLLKSFIKSFNDDKMKFTPMIYLFHTANFSLDVNDSILFDGFLFRVDSNFKIYEDLIKKKSLKNGSKLLKCVLFECQMSADFEQVNRDNFTFEIDVSETINSRNTFFLVDKLKLVCDALVQKRVDVVLCQKVIHPSIRQYLYERNVISIERLSLSNMKPLAELTGCRICSSAYNLDQFNDDAVFGYLTNLTIKRVEKLSKDYLYLESSSSNVQTLIVCLPDETFNDDVEYLLNVTESCFQRAILNGYLVCGGPCFYSYIVCYIWKCLVEDYESLKSEIELSKSELYGFMVSIKKVFVNYFKYLLNDVSENFVDYQIQTSNGHLFKANEECCTCGAAKRGNVTTNYLQITDENENFSHFDFNLFLHEKIENINENVKLVDCLESRASAMKTVQTLLLSIFKIGVFVTD